MKDFVDKGSRIRMALNFSIATLEVKRLWKNAFTISRENDFQPTFLSLAMLSINRRLKYRYF